MAITVYPSETTLDSVEVSSANSTSSLLTAGSTFTGTGELSNYPDVMVTVVTDQSGTLYMEFSSDGTNWDSSLSFQYIVGRINPPHILVKGARYYRTRFTNTSASDQTYLRLQTSYGSYQKLTAPIDGTLADNYDALATRPTDFKYEVADGKRQGNTTWNKFGYNSNVSSSGEHILASFGGTAFTPLTSADTLDIVSTSSNDTNSSGTGARQLLINGVDGDLNEVTEIVNLNGTTAVTTTNSYLGVNRISVITSGSLNYNAGTISVTDTTGGADQAELPAESSVTQQMIFYIKANYTAMVDWLFFNINRLSGGGNPRATIKGYAYSYITGTRYEIFRHTMDTATDTILQLTPSQPFVLTEKECVYFTIDSNSNNTVINARMSLIEIRGL